MCACIFIQILSVVRIWYQPPSICALLRAFCTQLFPSPRGIGRRRMKNHYSLFIIIIMRRARNSATHEARFFFLTSLDLGKYENKTIFGTGFRDKILVQLHPFYGFLKPGFRPQSWLVQYFLSSHNIFLQLSQLEQPNQLSCKCFFAWMAQEK